MSLSQGSWNFEEEGGSRGGLMRPAGEERGCRAWPVGQGAQAVSELLCDGPSLPGPEAVVGHLEAVLSQRALGALVSAGRPSAATGAPTERRSGVAGPAEAGKGKGAPQTAVVARRAWRPAGPGSAAWLAREQPLNTEQHLVVFLGSAVVRAAWTTIAVSAVAGGAKRVLGLWRGSTADELVAKAVLADLLRRGMTGKAGLLVVHDGSPALDQALESAWGRRALVAHCQNSVCRRVLGHLGEKEQSGVRQRFRQACAAPPEQQARRLDELVAALAETRPDAAACLQRSCGRLCTVTALGLLPKLRAHVQGIGPVGELARAGAAHRGAAVGPEAVAAVLPALLPGMRRLIGHEGLPVLQERLALHVAACGEVTGPGKEKGPPPP